MSLFDPHPIKGAIITACGVYRYQLTRVWNSDLRPAAFIMLNPSTADAENDDPTIRRCIGFAKAWGCGGLTVVNLFAYRSTDPKAMRGVRDPVGPLNDTYIRAAAEHCHPVVAAWGTHGTLRQRATEVKMILLRTGVSIVSLGVTKDGHPKHPLYVAGKTTPATFITPGVP